jgi:hypothetical protein
MAQAKKQDVTLDLDALEREDAPELFVLKLGGKQYKLTDPRGLAWEDLTSLAAGESLHFLTPAVQGDARDAFNEALKKLPSWKVDKLADAYRAHFALPSAGEADASPES